jgi:hypothetical protein
VAASWDTVTPFTTTVTQSIPLLAPAALDSATPTSDVCAAMVVSITPDSFPQHIGWKVVREEDGVVIMSGGGSGDSKTVCARLGSPFRFEIHDWNGDGLCCGAGAGSFTFTVGGTTVASGSDFGDQVVTRFGFLAPTVVSTANRAKVLVRVDVAAGATSNSVTIPIYASNSLGMTTAQVTAEYVCQGQAPPSPSPSPSASMSPSPSATPVPARYMGINAVGDYAAVTKTSALNFGSTVSFTVSAYIKSSNEPGDGCIVCDKNWNSGANAVRVCDLLSFRWYLPPLCSVADCAGLYASWRRASRSRSTTRSCGGTSAMALAPAARTLSRRWSSRTARGTTWRRWWTVRRAAR